MNGAPFVLAGTELVLLAEGGVFWPEEATLIVADLHLEKGSNLARRGRGLPPPYDSRVTLQRLAGMIRDLEARRVICLGDSFDDPGAFARLPTAERATVAATARRIEWLWVSGNHDPLPVQELGGRTVPEAALGALVLRHQAFDGVGGGSGEISGHYHPKATVAIAGRRLRGRCFVHDGQRLILPAFGAYTGGLDVFDPALRALFPGAFAVHLIGRERVHRLSSQRLVKAAGRTAPRSDCAPGCR